MKRTIFIVVLVAVTGLGILARSALSGGAEAARAPRQELPETSNLLRPDSERAAVVPAAEVPEPAEMQMARLAASHGDKLLQRAAKEATRQKLLRQAVAHFRACLAYETIAPKGEPIFAEARAKLAQAEQQLAKATAPRLLHAPRELVEEKPAPAPAVVSAPVVQKKLAPPAPMPTAVGPDGVGFRLAKTE
jgi:hypothetical protein